MILPEFKFVWLSLVAVFAFTLTYYFVSSYYLDLERAELIKDAAAEYRRIDKDAGKTADKLAGKFKDLQSKFTEKKKLKEKEQKSKDKKVLGIAKSQILLDLSQALPNSVKLSSFVSAGPGSPDSEFEAVITLERAPSEDEFSKLKATIEKPLKDRSYTTSFEKLPSGRDFRVKGLSKGGKL